jgi:hypothetical membrane protein
MQRPTLPIAALFACGAAAGPMYVTVTLIEAATRPGFDLRHHRFSWLTTGDFGWIQQANMILVGALMILLAVALRRALREGVGAVWAPRLLALFGASYVVGGLLTADPVAGFPPGTTPEMVRVTWHGIAQNASRSASSVFMLATSLVLARRFATQKSPGWAGFYAAGIPVVFAVLTAVGLGIGGNPVALAFLLTPWIWATVLALHLSGRGSSQETAAPSAVQWRSL